MSEKEGTYECGNCTGRQTKTHYSYYECDGCYEPLGPVEVTSNDELRELIKEWRERGVEEPYGMTWLKPADELEELIDDE